MAREGKRIRTKYLEVRVVASLLRHPRVGFIVPRYKHSAVARNLLKRRLREITRVELLPELETLDVVIRTQPAAYEAGYEALKGDLLGATKRLRVKNTG